MNRELSDTITFAVGCVSVAAVIMTIAVSIYLGTVNSDRVYQDSMRQCVEAGGTYVPTVTRAACIINNRGINP